MEHRRGFQALPIVTAVREPSSRKYHLNGLLKYQPKLVRRHRAALVRYLLALLLLALSEVDAP